VTSNFVVTRGLIKKEIHTTKAKMNTKQRDTHHPKTDGDKPLKGSEKKKDGLKGKK